MQTFTASYTEASLAKTRGVARNLIWVGINVNYSHCKETNKKSELMLMRRATASV